MRRTKILAGLSAFLLLTLVISSFRRSSRNPVSTLVLLNPKLAGRISSISMSSGGKEARLFRNEGSWLVSNGLVTLPADRIAAEQVLERLSAPRKFSAVTDKASDAESLGFGGEGELLASFADEEGNVLLELRLAGREGGRLYVKGDSGTVYAFVMEREAAEIAAILGARMQSLAEPLLLPAAALGVSGRIQSARMQFASNGKVLDVTKNDFLQKARHGPVLETKFDSEGRPPESVLYVDYGGGGSCRMEFYKIGGEDFFVCVPEWKAGLSAGGARIPADYAVTISAWTYGRLTDG